jgi:hypothetical protein
VKNDWARRKAKKARTATILGGRRGMKVGGRVGDSAHHFQSYMPLLRLAVT